MMRRAILIGGMVAGVALNAQTPPQLERFQSAVVRVTTMTQEGARREGTGFVVRLTGDAAQIVTVAHVVEGASDVRVEFFTRRAAPVAARVVDLEGGEPQGLAILSVAGEIPENTAALSLDAAASVRAGEPVTIVGFPRAGAPWAVTNGAVVGRKAKTVVFTGGVDEGSSGGPLIKDGRVIGVIAEARGSFGYAVAAPVAKYVLESWGVQFGARLRSDPANVAPGYIIRMIADNGFHHPGDASADGLSPSVAGTFEHDYEPLAIGTDRVVIDHATGLMWQAAGAPIGIHWRVARAYADELNGEGFAGFDDWRLPTIEELASLMESIGRGGGGFLDRVFAMPWSHEWSADSWGSRSWALNLRDGHILSAERDAEFAARGVRSVLADDSIEEDRSPPKAPVLSSRLQSTKIAFTSGSGDEPQLLVMNADGSEPVVVADRAARGARAAWSPDGTTLAILAPSPDGDRDARALDLVPLDGRPRRRLLLDKVYSDPAWSPDGTRIALLCRLDNHWGLCMIDVAGGSGPSALRIAGNLFVGVGSAGQVAWSPDGMRIAVAVSSATALAVVDLEAATMTEIGTDGSEPAWSPDGSRLAFARSEIVDRSRTRDIYTVNADGTNLTRVTEHPADDVMPSWSPDGSKIAFASTRFGYWAIYVTNADGSDPVRLTPPTRSDTAPAWSPFLEP